MISLEKLRWIVVGALLLQLINYGIGVLSPVGLSGGGISTGEEQQKNMLCVGDKCFCKPGYIGASCTLGVADLSGQVRLLELEVSEINKEVKENLPQSLEDFKLLLNDLPKLRDEQQQLRVSMKDGALSQNLLEEYRTHQKQIDLLKQQQITLKEEVSQFRSLIAALKTQMQELRSEQQFEQEENHLNDEGTGEGYEDIFEDRDGEADGDGDAEEEEEIYEDDGGDEPEKDVEEVEEEEEEEEEPEEDVEEISVEIPRKGKHPNVDAEDEENDEENDEERWIL